MYKQVSTYARFNINITLNPNVIIGIRKSINICVSTSITVLCIILSAELFVLILVFT